MDQWSINQQIIKTRQIDMQMDRHVDGWTNRQINTKSKYKIMIYYSTWINKKGNKYKVIITALVLEIVDIKVNYLILSNSFYS